MRWGPFLCAAVSVLAAELGAPLSWHAYLVLLLPLYPLMPASFYAAITAIQVLAAAAVFLMAPAEGAALYRAACAVASPAVLLLALAAGRWPRADTRLAAQYGRVLRTGYKLAAAALFLAVFWRPFALHLTVPWLVFAAAAWYALPGAEPLAWRARIAATAKAAALLGLGLAGAVVFLEAGARALIPETTPHLQLHALHPEYLRTLRPKGTAVYHIPVDESELKPVRAEISRQGLRDRVLGPKPADELRILLLGDSFVFGWATDAEESIPRQLEDILAERLPDVRIRVINAGIGGTGPWQQHGLLRERGFVHQPGIVVHGVFALNDIGDTLVRVGKTLEVIEAWETERVPLYRNRHRIPVALHVWLDRHSHLYNVLRAQETVFDYMGIIGWVNRIRGLAPVAIPARPARDRHPIIEANLAEWYPELQLGFELLCEDIRGIQEDCIARGVAYAAFSVPSLYDVHDATLDYFRQKAVEDVAYVRAKSLHKTEGFFEAEGIPYIEVWSHLEAHPNPPDLFYMHDGHYNPDGCRLVAEVLADAIIRDILPTVPGPHQAAMPGH